MVVISQHSQCGAHKAVAADMLHAETQLAVMPGDFIEQQHIIMGDAVEMHAGMEAEEQPQLLRAGVNLARLGAKDMEMLIRRVQLNASETQLRNFIHLLLQMPARKINHAKAK